ncbi:MAG: hypothetical protein HKL99_07590 [Burkholderiales bacterium]|jgi:formylmethanofuran dehydrogenase subunit B|nr:hypothetical protein [Burkholderiales bacterium]
MPASSVTCPFCGLLCDDLVVGLRDGRARVEAAGCARAVALFPAPPQGQARVDGSPATWPQAARAAATLLAQARQPLIAGLGCDIAGQRAAVMLAERVDAALDPMDSTAQQRNPFPFQDSGWMSTTLSELRNRADVVVLAGTLGAYQPRLVERCLAPTLSSPFGELHRRIIAIGSALLRPAAWPAGADLANIIDLPNLHLAEAFGLLRARLAGQRLDATALHGVALERFDALLETMHSARYGVLIWSAAELDFPHADLAVRAMAELVRELNTRTRWSVLPLGGGDGGTSAAQVCTWLAGYPPRLRFVNGMAQSDPLQRGADTLLAAGEADALLWISAFDPARTPPPARCPRIVLGRADLRLDPAPDVFIPVAVPGVQAPGMLSRMDQVVTLPLMAPAPADLPTVAEVLARITQELGHAAAA